MKMTVLRVVCTKYKGLFAMLEPYGKSRSWRGLLESTKKTGPNFLCGFHVFTTHVVAYSITSETTTATATRTSRNKRFYEPNNGSARAL